MKALLGCCASLFCTNLFSADLVIDWSLDFRGTPSASPPLHLVCIGTKSTYTIEGKPADPNQANPHLYLLPSEVLGRCILSLEHAQFSTGFDGFVEIDIKSVQQSLKVTFPTKSLLLSVKITGDLQPTIRKELRLFRIGSDGLPRQDWVYYTEIPRESVAQKRNSVLTYAAPGNYLAYITTAQDESANGAVAYLYAKKISVTAEQLASHGSQTTVRELIENKNTLLIEFLEKDVFEGVVAFNFVGWNPVRHLWINERGEIESGSK